ncbi:MAG: hypothetical protein LBF28_00420 [Rickettsiales bacterium]|jgi:hypothetical protein|nr:hypothetical protein [Rickettsiales bacterium]
MAGFLIFSLCLFSMATGAAGAATSRAAASDFISPTAYQTMYPAMTNKMRVDLNPGTTPEFSSNSVSTLTRTSNNDGRRVVSRSAARSASTGTISSTAARSSTSNIGGATAARAGIVATSSPAASSSAAQTRRVVSRRNSGQSTTARSGRAENSYTYRAIEASANTTMLSTDASLPADRCLADYTTCMNGYCQRENTAYNRCYCASRLAQIDAEYQPAIDNLVKQILELTGTNNWSKDEMNAYWDDIIGSHTGDNSWIKLENALDINWTDTESRVRGQQAFLTGHEYCAQHLRGCQYMANNMRDAYRSDIARDCAAYENSLQKMKNAAESFLESYND